MELTAGCGPRCCDLGCEDANEALEGGGLVDGRWKNGGSRRQVVNVVGKGFCRRDCLVHVGRGGHVYLGGESGEGVGVAFTLGLGDPHAISVVVFVCGSDVPAVHGVRCP